MEFNQTKTFSNLAKAFAGESQAGMRYQMVAKLALDQGYKTLSDEIKEIAKNETVHAKTLFDFIIANNGNTKDIEICASYPFSGDTIENGLKAGIEAEIHEGEVIYPEFSKIAFQEGFKEISDVLLRIADVENHHRIIFEYLYKHYTDGTLFKSDKPLVYECSNCGYRFTAKQAFSVCPLCKASQGFVKLQLP